MSSKVSPKPDDYLAVLYRMSDTKSNLTDLYIRENSSFGADIKLLNEIDARRVTYAHRIRLWRAVHDASVENQP